MRISDWSSDVCSSDLIGQVFGRRDIGLLGHVLASMGSDYNYAQNAFDAWATVIVMDVWHWTSLVVLLCYAGLVSIPEAYYQAARIDGASRWKVRSEEHTSEL